MRTRADYVRDFRIALSEVPLSLRKLYRVAEEAYVDCHDIEPWQDKLDYPLAGCVRDFKALDACDELALVTIRDLAGYGRDRLLRSKRIGIHTFLRIHDGVFEELEDHLLSRFLGDADLHKVLEHGIVLTSQLRERSPDWPAKVFPRKLCATISALQGLTYFQDRSERHELELELRRINGKPKARKVVS